MNNTGQPNTRAYDLFKATVAAALGVIILILLLRGGGAAPGGAQAPGTIPPTAISVATPAPQPTEPPPTPTPVPIAQPRLNPPQVGSDGTVRLTGTGQPGATLQVAADGAVLGTAQVGTDGAWSFGAQLPPGDHTVAVRTLDAAGAVANEAPPLAVQVPAPPVKLTLPSVPLVSGSQQTLSGTAPPGSVVEVLVDGVPAARTTVGADGGWRLSLDLPPAGEHSLVARAVDAAGKVLSATEPIALTVQPRSPTVEVVSTEGALALAGTAEPGTQVAVVVDGQAVGTATADAEGKWAFSAPVEPGTRSVAVQSLAADGAVVATSQPIAVEVSAPAGTTAAGAGAGSAGGAAGSGTAGSAAGSGASAGSTGGATGTGAGVGSTGGATGTGTPSALQRAPQGQAYVVQADDWLSKLALRFLDDARAYPKIVAATNLKAAEDPTFARIENPDLIEVGWKLWIPVASWSP